MAWDASETSQLRQLALAHGIYVSQHDDAEPGSTIPIIRTEIAPTYLDNSPLDPFPEGWANLSRGTIEPHTAYKDSFQTLAISAGAQFFDEFRDSENGGWLISAGTSLARYGDRAIFESAPYKRLTFSGGVIRRRSPSGSGNNGGIYMDRCFTDDIVIPDTP